MEPTTQNDTPIRHTVAYVGTYPPQECGIATFTLDLVNSTDISGWCSIVAAVGEAAPDESADAPDEVETDEEMTPLPDSKQVYAVKTEKPADYARAARFVEKLGADLISIQHEYGIYGGDHGEYVLNIARAATVPVVVTLHTVLPNPSERQRAIIRDLSPLVDKFVVMAHKGEELLQTAYGIPGEKIHFIPHGAPDVFLEVEGVTKVAFDLQDKRVLSTFGLISPNKGIEDAIAALPAVVEKEPNTLYLILGATHPTIKRREGEWYRESLQKQVEDLGLQENVRFVNHFLSVQELIDYLLATDVYITPYYANPHQITSGTLAYAMATGRVIVSTPYLYAEELLAEGRGFLYPFRDTKVLSDQLIRLLTDHDLFEVTRKRAYDYGRQMTWPCVGLEYVQLFRELLRARGQDPGPAPEAFATAGHRDVVREMVDEMVEEMAEETEAEPVYPPIG
jgi:glycosyltransferase involved in cell wall biosynthesis